MPDLLLATKKELADRGLVSPLGGHVGDGKHISFFFQKKVGTSDGPISGNFHCFILYKTEEEMKLVMEVVDAMVHKAISLDGTCKISSAHA